MPQQQQQQQQKPSALSAQPSSTSGLLSRSNPMSVSSMLSGPPRAQPISAYSPTPGASTPTPSSAATPQPPVLPPDNRTTAAAAGEHKPSSAPRTQPGATLPAYASSLIAPTAAAAAKPKAAVEQPHQPAVAPASASSTVTATAASSTAARSSYPPLPSAFARESPYSPAPAASAPPSGAGTPQHPHQHSHQHHQHSQHQQQQQQQQQQASAAALKNSLFPNLGSYRPAGSPTQPPARPQQQSTPSSTSTSASTPYQWQAQAAQQAQQVQQQQQAQRFGQQNGAGQAAQQGKGAQAAAPALGAAARPGQPLGQPASAAAAATKAPAQPQYQNRFPPTLGTADPHRASVHAQQAASAVAPSAAQQSAATATASAQSGFKRRRSDAAEQSQQQQPMQRAKPAPPAAAVERAPVSPPETPAPVNTTPLFTYDEWRKAMVRPPIVEVLNDAVDAWAKKHGSAKGDGKRKYLGRVTYNALTPPAELLDGATLAHNVGGYVEVVVPTSWITGPHSPPSLSSSSPSERADDEIRSSCSVPPVDAHPVALSFGPPSAYTGAPLPLTSPTTPLVLPSHLADLPTVRQRQVWGTDVYTDDSDVLLVLLHSGWLRVTRRDRRLRAGEKGAGADAVRRAKTVGEERITAPGRDAEGEQEKVPTALLVRLGVVPALVRYEGIERQGIRSRSWGNGHDGVSLRIEDVLSLDVRPSLSALSWRAQGALADLDSTCLQDVPRPRATRLRKPRAAACAHQIADLHRSAYPHLHAHDDHHDDLAPHACPPPPPKQYRFSARRGPDDAEAEGNDEDIVVTDTFVLELGEGRGRFVGLEDEDERGEDEEMGDETAQAMEVEAA